MVARAPLLALLYRIKVHAGQTRRTPVKKLIGLGLLLLVACQRKVQVSSPAPVPATTGTAGSVGVVGGGTPAEALSGFMAAAKSEDLQAVGAFWGDPEGSAREKMSRSEFEMRAFIVVKCVRHDKYTVLSEGSAAGGRRVMNVQITKDGGPRGVLTKSSNFTLVRGPQSRWFVENVDLEPLTPICQLP